MKNRKLTVNRLALGNLKTRKKQYTLMIIGIVLAMIFSSGMLFFISCIQSSKEEQARREIGDFYGYYYQPIYMDAEQGQKDGYIEKYGYSHIIGYGYIEEEKKDKGTPIAWLDDNAKDLYYVTVNEGKYPDKPGEIAFEENAALRLGIEPVIGSKVTLSVLTPDGTDYRPDAQKKTYTLVGILSDKRSNFEQVHSVDLTPPMAAAFVCDGEEVAVGGKEITALYYQATNESLTEDILQNDGFGHTYNVSRFKKYFMQAVYEKAGLHPDDSSLSKHHMSSNSESYGSSVSVLENSTLISVLAGVLMLASCIGIINAFTTNLQERRKQIGLLRAVGATKRQIINVFGREAFIITLICAPVSVTISYFAVWVFAKIMGGSFIFLPNPWVLIGTTLISIACVMLSALIPLYTASRVSPMQAIRNVNLSRKMKQKKIKQQKEFNAPKLLASRSIKFYKGKQVGVSLILMITIFLTCFGISFLKAESQNAGWEKFNTGDYRITRMDNPNVTDWVNFPNIVKAISLNDVQDILSFPLFTSIYGSKECSSYILTDEYSDYMRLLSLSHNGIRYGGFQNLTNIESELNSVKGNLDEVIKTWVKESDSPSYTNLKSVSNTSKEMFKVKIWGFDEVLFQKHINDFEVIDGKIDIDKLNSGEEIILVASEEIAFSAGFFENGEIESYNVRDISKTREGRTIFATSKLDYKAGDTIDLKTLFSDQTEVDFDEHGIEKLNSVYSTEKKVKIGAIVKIFRFGDYMWSDDELDIVSTMDGMQALTNYDFGYEALHINLKGENNDEIDQAASTHLDSIVSGTAFRYRSGHQWDKELMNTVRMLFIGMTSIIILFFAICASIINNSLTAKIRESKREIGTLRAVGASTRELTGSYVRQLLSMFGWGCVAGFLVYTITHIVIKLFFPDFLDITFEIWQAMLIVLLLFVICSLNLYAKIKQEMKNSIVENIREL